MPEGFWWGREQSSLKMKLICTKSLRPLKRLQGVLERALEKQQGERVGPCLEEQTGLGAPQGASYWVPPPLHESLLGVATFLGVQERTDSRPRASPAKTPYPMKSRKAEGASNDR